MNKIKIYSALSLLLILPILLFTRCNKHDEITSSNKVDFDSPAFALVDFTDVNNAVDDATLDTPMSLNATMFDYGFLNMADFKPGNIGMMLTRGGRWMQLFDWGKHLGLTFRGLKLSDDQKTAIKELVTAYHESVKPLVKEFADANKSIIDDANVQRKAIADDVKANKLTRAEAAVKIKKLNEDTRTAIENNPVSKTVKEKMCKQRADLLTVIGGKLTGDQITKWNDIISKLKSPCQ